MSLATIATKYKVIVGIAVLVLLAATPSVYYFRQYQKAQLRINNPSEAAKQDAADTVTAVGKLILLPQGEDPTVMQVTDVSKLKDQPFFANAQNGDKVLIYTKARKAILYRSDTNQIIDVAPVNLGNNNATVSAQTKPAPLGTSSGVLMSTPTPTAKPATSSAGIRK